MRIATVQSLTIITVKKPKVALIEAVPGILTNKKLNKEVYAKWIQKYLVVMVFFELQTNTLGKLQTIFSCHPALIITWWMG